MRSYHCDANADIAIRSQDIFSFGVLKRDRGGYRRLRSFTSDSA